MYANRITLANGAGKTGLLNDSRQLAPQIMAAVACRELDEKGNQDGMSNPIVTKMTGKNCFPPAAGPIFSPVFKPILLDDLTDGLT